MLEMRFFKGSTQSEIGEVLGITQMQVSRLLSALLAPAPRRARGVTPEVRSLTLACSADAGGAGPVTARGDSQETAQRSAAAMWAGDRASRRWG